MKQKSKIQRLLLYKIQDLALESQVCLRKQAVATHWKSKKMQSHRQNLLKTMYQTILLQRMQTLDQELTRIDRLLFKNPQL